VDTCNKTKTADLFIAVLLQFSCICVDAYNKGACDQTKVCFIAVLFHFYCSCADRFRVMAMQYRRSYSASRYGKFRTKTGFLTRTAGKLTELDKDC